MRRRWLLFGSAMLAGCGAPSWSPPPPGGVTWRYDHQGFHARTTTVMAGSIRGPSAALVYGGAFSFGEQAGAGRSASADPFAESSPIDAVRFNEHLAGQGRPLAPCTSGPIAAASAPAPASASPSASGAPGAPAPSHSAGAGP